jgi:hypothetical protein
MSNVENDFDESTPEKKPRKARKRNTQRKANFYLIEGSNSREVGQFPESTIGTPLERKIPPFAQDMFGRMVNDITRMKADIRKPNGAFDTSLDFTINPEPSRAEIEKQNVIEIEPELEDQIDEPDEIEFEADQNINALQLQLMIEKEKNKRLYSEVQAIKAGSQNEMQTTVTALEKAYEQNRELMMLMLTQAQRPQQDATTQAMGILEKSLGIVTRAKAISEEISPQESGGASSSYLSDAARLVDSLGKINVGQFIPLFFNRAASVPTVKPDKPEAGRRPAKPKASDGNGNGQGELSDLFTKVKKKKEGEKK